MIKFLIEFAPLVAFFLGYKSGGILNATLYLVVASVVAIIAGYILERKINKVNVISTIILLISASLTLFSGNSIFIKMKPTILYLIFSAIFFVTNYKWNPAIEYILGHAIKLKNREKWVLLNQRFMFFFLIMACCNEVIWRNFSEESWVSFKVFAVLPITFVFILSQMPFIMKHRIEEEENSAS